MGVGLRGARRLLHIQVAVVELDVGIGIGIRVGNGGGVGVGFGGEGAVGAIIKARSVAIVVVLRGLRLVVRGVVQVDYLFAVVVEAIVGLGRGRTRVVLLVWLVVLLVLGGAEGAGFEVLQRVGGEVVKVVVGEAKVVVGHCRFIGRRGAASACPNAALERRRGEGATRCLRVRVRVRVDVGVGAGGGGVAHSHAGGGAMTSARRDLSAAISQPARLRQSLSP